jgi:catechol 2,3-dioxygenase-like lactoylglutathione lyase family enzyme
VDYIVRFANGYKGLQTSANVGGRRSVNYGSEGCGFDSRRAHCLAKEIPHCFVVRVTPADAEGVARGIGVDLVPLGCGEVCGCREHARPQRDRFAMCCGNVVDVKIDVNLLRAAVGPVGRYVVRSELHTDDPAVVGIEDTVEVVVGEHSAIEHPGPECAFGCEVAGVEYDHSSHDSHLAMLADPSSVPDFQPEGGALGMPLSLNDIGAITLFVADVGTSKTWYRNAFAVPVVFEDAESAVFKFEHTLVNLLAASAAPELIAPAPVASWKAGAQFQLTIWVDDCDAACAELQARGVELINGPMNRAWGQRTACFADPDGHIWELAQTLS